MLRLLALLLALLAAPAWAQMYDGLDNNGDGVVDDANEYDGGGGGGGQTEAMCNATARLDLCLAAYDLYCREFGLEAPCALMQIGQHCYGGDPAQCQYFQELMFANRDCQAGNQAGCDWLTQQPIAQLWLNR